MAKIVCVVNKKGGIGKTTTVCTLAELLSLYGLKVLVIDLNPGQSNTSLNFNRLNEVNTVVKIYKHGNMNRKEIKELIKHTDFTNIDLIPGNPDAQEEEDKIVISSGVDPDLILKKALSCIRDDYDFIIIDTTPAFNFLTRSALCASDGVLIPVEDDMYNYTGVSGVVKSILRIKDSLNPDLRIYGIFLTKVNSVTRTFKSFREVYGEDVEEYLLNTYIRFSQLLKESYTTGRSVIEYAKKSTSLLDYRKLLLELDWLSGKAKAELKKDISQGEKQEQLLLDNKKKKKLGLFN